MFHNNLESLIRTHKVNKSELSRILGISRSTLNSYLSGKSHMPADKIEQTAKYIGVTAASLFAEKKDKDKPLQEKVEKLERDIEKLNKQVETIANILRMKG